MPYVKEQASAAGTAPTNELLALEALLQPLRSHDVLHHRDGRQELHGACHLAGNEVGTLVRGLSNLSTQDVQLLKPQTAESHAREARPRMGLDSALLSCT